MSTFILGHVKGTNSFLYNNLYNILSKGISLHVPLIPKNSAALLFDRLKVNVYTIQRNTKLVKEEPSRMDPIN